MQIDRQQPFQVLYRPSYELSLIRLKINLETRVQQITHPRTVLTLQTFRTET